MEKESSSRDFLFMKIALDLALKAGLSGEVPVGAVVVSGDEIIGRGSNSSVSSNDPTAHAEMLALREAGSHLKNYRLGQCDLYVTLEPCAMCLGAAVHARIRKLYYGTKDPKGGAVESAIVFPMDRMNHNIEIKSGILSQECGKILKDFFKARR